MSRRRSRPAQLVVDLLWIPVNILQAVVAWVWTCACITLALLVRVVTGSTKLPLGMARWMWAPGMLRIGGVRYEVRGLDRVDWSKPYFIASNHQSFVDIVVLFHALPQNLHFVVKQELSTVPFLAWYIRAMGMIFVDRGSGKKARASVQRTIDLVAGGKTVLIFPEGTRSRDGSIRPLKSGALAVAAAGSVPLVPVALDGCLDIVPPHALRIRPGRVEINVGAPIATDGYSPDDRRRLADDVRQEMVRLLAELRASAKAGAEEGPAGHSTLA